MSGIVGSESTPSTAIRVDALFDEVRSGLRRRPKRLPEKLLYDEVGSRIFREITRLEAYYPTRSELEILERYLPDVARHLGRGARVVEFGSGEGRKTEMLLETLEDPGACIPIDIAEEQLLESCERLRLAFPTLEVVPIATDFTRPFRLPSPSNGGPVAPPFFFFPGSTIGNFEPYQAEDFLRRIGEIGGTGSTLLVGVDLAKPRELLELAYDDPGGVTARFNLNALVHLNRILDADFDPHRFRHRAVWNSSRSRIEMQLVSVADQTITFSPGLPGTEPFRVEIRSDEAVVTEHSYKYSIGGFTSLCRGAGWKTLKSWTDDRGWFSVHFLEREGRI
jgi:dimethylhistidine N-methyltransferase